jgi:tRNA dimethylallyltransferase
MGPTASGKTALASELIKRFPFEIISVDSAMIYRGMDIGTAKPTLIEQEVAPHHLIDIIDPPESFSAAAFCNETHLLCQAILKRGNIPILVGGTMMYFNALQQGLSTLPEADKACRIQISQQALVEGWEALHAQLSLIDTCSAAKIHPNDAQRIQRALEVYHLTGKPLSELLAQKNKLPYTFINFLLLPADRGWLHKRIALRFEQMLAQGFIKEVEQLMQQWQLPASAPAMRCVGYRQVYEYLAGKDDFATFSYKGVAATRQLAKRQLTWLRHWPNGERFACDKEGVSEEIMALLSSQF